MKSMDELREEIRILKQNHIDTDELVRIADAIEQEIDSDYMRLPRDKSGMPIRIGDEMVFDRLDGTQIRRCVKYVAPYGFAGFEDCPEKEVALEMCIASVHQHYKPPTVEDVLRDFAYCLEDGVTDQSLDEIVAEYAPKLRLREEDDE